MKIETDLPDGVNVTLGSATSSPQAVSGPQSFIRLTVTLPVNGLDYRLSVAESTPSTVVLSPTTSKNQASSKRATTDQTRTPSTTSQVTSTESATDATTAGTRRTTRTTTRTSGGQATKKKKHGGRPKIYAKRDREIYKDRKGGMSYKEVALKHGVTPEHASVIFGKMKKQYAQQVAVARAARWNKESA